MDPTKAKCSKCNKYVNKTNLARHIRTHAKPKKRKQKPAKNDKKKNYKCKFCNIEIEKRHLFLSHLKKHFKGTSPNTLTRCKLTCVKCNISFTDPSEHSRHLKSAHSTTCRACNRVFSGKDSGVLLRKHIRSVHFNKFGIKEDVESKKVGDSWTKNVNGFVVQYTKEKRNTIVMKCIVSESVSQPDTSLKLRINKKRILPQTSDTDTSGDEAVLSKKNRKECSKAPEKNTKAIKNVKISDHNSDKDNKLLSPLEGTYMLSFYGKTDSLCCEMYAKKKSLKNHLRKVHMKLGVIKCRTCEKVFKKTKQLGRHRCKVQLENKS